MSGNRMWVRGRGIAIAVAALVALSVFSVGFVSAVPTGSDQAAESSLDASAGASAADATADGNQSRRAELDTTDGVVTVRVEEGQRITGRTDVEAGTNLSLRINSQSDTSPFLTTLITTVESGGGSGELPNSFTFTGDFSERAAGISFEAVVRHDGSAVSTTYDGRLLASARGSISLSGQTVTDGNQSVSVDSTTLSDGGYVVLHRDDPNGSVLGHSRYLESGVHSAVSVPLETTLSGETTVVAVPYLDDDDDGVLEPNEDAPYTGEAGSAVTDSAAINASGNNDSSSNVSAKAGVAVNGSTAYAIDDGQIRTVNLTTGETVDSFEAPAGRPRGLAYGNGSLWFADGVQPDYNGEIVELNPETGEVRSRIDTSYDPRGLGFGDGSLWVIDITLNDVVEYNPDGTELSRFDTRGPTGSTWALGLAYAGGSVWFGTHGGGLHEFATNGTHLREVNSRDTMYGGLAANETTLFGPGTDGNLTALRTFDEADNGESPANESGVTVRLAPTGDEINANGTATYDVVVENIDAGVGSIGYDVTVGNTTVGTVESVSVNSGFPSTFTTTELASNGSTVSVQVAGGDTADTGTVTVGNVTLRGHAVGTATVDLSVDSVGDENGSSYTVAGSQDATLTVRSQPAGVTVVGGTPSGDGPGQFAGDGVHQDVNGDGSVTLADVTALFKNYNSNAVQNNPTLFDYNGDGSITLADVTTLFNQVSA